MPRADGRWRKSEIENFVVLGKEEMNPAQQRASQAIQQFSPCEDRELRTQESMSNTTLVKSLAEVPHALLTRNVLVKSDKNTGE